MRTRMVAMLVGVCVAGVAQAAEEDVCFDAVQGKVAWNQAGATGWDASNVRALCRGTTDHAATIACFSREIARSDDWGKAIALCSAARADGGPAGAIPQLGLTVHKAGDAPPRKRPPPQPPKREFLNGLVCSTREVTISDSFDANYVGKSEALRKVLMPGQIFHLDDLLNGSFAAIGGARLPYRIYVNFNDRIVDMDGSEADLFEIRERNDSTLFRDVDGTMSSIQGAISSLVSSRGRNANYASSFEVHEIATDSQLNIAMQGAASYNGFSMDGTFDFDQHDSRSKIVGQFLQRYYGVTVDFTANNGYGPEAWFDGSMIERLRADEAEKGPLVYIDSVVYGRAAYFFTETGKSDLDVAATLNTAYSGASVEASADVKTKYQSHFSSDALRVITIGAGTDGGQVVETIEEFREIVKESPRPGALGDAIAYTVRFVDDNSIAMVNVATTYPERTCTRLDNKVAVGVDRIKVNVADDEGTDNAIEIVATAMVTAVYDAYETDEKGVTRRVDRYAPPQLLSIETALGDSGSEKTGIDKYVVFEIPDDPFTEDVNETKTARFQIAWTTVYEDDGSSADDVLSPMNTDDGLRRLTLLDVEKGLRRPFFRFRGADQQSPDADVELYFSLRPAN